MDEKRVSDLIEEYISLHPEADPEECRRYSVQDITLSDEPLGGIRTTTETKMGVGPKGLVEFIQQRLNASRPR